jgi:hypothetical protein
MTAQLITIITFVLAQGIIDIMSPNVNSSKKKGNYVDLLAYISPIVIP